MPRQTRDEENSAAQYREPNFFDKIGLLMTSAAPLFSQNNAAQQQQLLNNARSAQEAWARTHGPRLPPSPAMSASGAGGLDFTHGRIPVSQEALRGPIVADMEEEEALRLAPRLSPWTSSKRWFNAP